MEALSKSFVSPKTCWCPGFLPMDVETGGLTRVTGRPHGLVDASRAYPYMVDGTESVARHARLPFTLAVSMLRTGN
jgi:hypothetical protein